MPLLLSSLLLAACRTPGAGGDAGTDHGMVVAAHPLAVEAGTRILQGGGSAIDAAVAVQMMLGLVEPQSSGIGGGAIVMTYDASTGEVTGYLGRETAPASASPAMLRDDDGRALPRAEAMLGGVATGVPGAVSAFAAAHRAHGRLPWAALFGDTIDRAEAGFVIGPRLARHIDGRFPQASAPDVVGYFSHPDGTRMQAGDRLRNPDYAATLRTLAREGATALHRGEIAADIVARTAAPPLAGGMTTEDLAAYTAETVRPLCRPLRAYVLCVPPPPASGVGLLQLMLLLDGTDIGTRGADDPRAWFLFAEASRLMYADRDRYVGDPRFVSVPVDGLLDAGYLDARRALIGDTAAPQYAAGTPAGAPPRVDDATREPAGTSHFVVVDAQGNAVSVTTTVESYFGSGRMVRGFFLNNQLTDFSWADADRPVPAANAVAPGKRPRSSMTPAILLDHDGRFLGAIGSPGGSAIPAYIAKALTGAFDWDLPLAQAIALPNLVARGERVDGEATRMSTELRAALARRGIEVRPGAGEDSGLHGVLLRDGRLDGAADPRREGVVGRP
ncbi:gamma-glutamyltransferase family protein [Luteimonas suaedae]|uniref:gamma-glutamyltransferase family protein n=1 Tax=Luteimonas suaedae TaxID=2605430 RepID=UPI0011EED670|nr:gamma-glutamyltransferase family protein [Luteimonas suaedae]